MYLTLPDCYPLHCRSNNDKDQTVGDAQESFSSDEAAPGGGNVEDSDMFDNMLAASGVKWRGSLRAIWKAPRPKDTPVLQPVKLPEMPIKPRLVMAAGTVFLQASFEKQNINSINNALLQNQADIIYVSSHCDASHCSAGGMAGLPSDKLKNYWDQDADVIIIAACHNLRIGRLDGIDYIFNPQADLSAVPPKTAGLDWYKNMPNAKVLLGYRFKAPRDTIWWKGKDIDMAKNIITAFLDKTNGGKGEAKALAEAWLNANKNAAITADVGKFEQDAAGNDISTGKEQRPYNACAIDVKAKKYYYWHHDTWSPSDKEPKLQVIDLP